nr:MAG: SMI1/KNR4 family protein [Actinomycetota bacterium]
MWDVDFIHGRIAEIRRLDPEFRLFGAREHRHRLNPPLSTEEILAFEKRMGVELPAAYRTFLATVGNGGAGPHYGLFGLAEALREDEKWHEGMPGFYATPFPHTTNWNPRFEEQPEDYEGPSWITGSLILGHFGCGAFHRLVVSGELAGEVWFDDRASDGGVTREGEFADWYLSWLDETYRKAREAAEKGVPAPW